MLFMCVRDMLITEYEFVRVVCKCLKDFASKKLLHYIIVMSHRFTAYKTYFTNDHLGVLRFNYV